MVYKIVLLFFFVQSYLFLTKNTFYYVTNIMYFCFKRQENVKFFGFIAYFVYFCKKTNSYDET